MAPRVGAALATRFSRFERLTILKTLGFAGGWLFEATTTLTRAGTTVELRVTDALLECYSSNQRVACHAVSHQRGQHRLWQNLAWVCLGTSGGKVGLLGAVRARWAAL